MRERRTLRSNDPQQALGHLLSHLADECGLEAAVISDADGLFMSGAARDPSVDLEALAALRNGQGVYATPLSYRGVTLYLIAQGRALDAGGERERAAAAVGRILELSAA